MLDLQWIFRYFFLVVQMMVLSLKMKDDFLLIRSYATESIAGDCNMDMKAALQERIAALESIVEHLSNDGGTQREHYLEKCEIYRHILTDLDNNGHSGIRKSSHQQNWRGLN
jgi:hypothetical protein